MKDHLNTIIFSLAAILTAFLLAGAYNTKFKKQETIMVTGLAEYNFSSDLIVWRGSFSKRSSDIKSAYAALKEDENNIRKYLKEQGIDEKELIFSSVEINKEYESYRDSYGNYLNKFSGYNLTQNIRIESGDIDKIERVSREVTQLIDLGVELNSQEPQYYYTKMSELKIELLAKASEDGKTRAQTIATNSGSKLGPLQKANMGVFQITGQNSNEDYSYGGTFNTRSRHKTASITMRMEFSIK
jgi:uncharacterized protein